LGILVTVLVFGMAVVGCDDGSDDDELTWTIAASGDVSIDNLYPVVGETITATFTRDTRPPYNDPKYDPIGTPSWQWYRSSTRPHSQSFPTDGTIISSGKTYTVTQSDVGFWLTAYIIYSGMKNDRLGASTSSTAMGIPATATVSVSINARRVLGNDSYSTMPNHYVTITLALSDGKWNEVSYDVAKNWIALSGIPSISFWVPPSFYTSPSVRQEGRNLFFSYSTRSETTLSINNLTVALVNSQLSTMRNYTNVYNALTAGTPSQVSVSEWVISQY